VASAVFLIGRQADNILLNMNGQVKLGTETIVLR
jgi:hypothetical protein